MLSHSSSLAVYNSSISSAINAVNGQVTDKTDNSAAAGTGTGLDDDDLMVPDEDDDDHHHHHQHRRNHTVDDIHD